jgi:transcriptional regulator with XRE-family HTH domain
MRKRNHEDIERLGQAIRSLRKAGRFSREGLAFEAGVNRTYSGCLERGEENVSALTILKLCAVLKVNASEILLEARLQNSPPNARGRDGARGHEPVKRVQPKVRSPPESFPLYTLDVFANPVFAVMRNARRFKQWPEAVGRPL